MSRSPAGSMDDESYRTLVVVPGSHIQPWGFRSLGGECKSCEHLAPRAVQLDVRPETVGSHNSVFLAWDSRLVHQGHTKEPGPAVGFAPPVFRPPLYTIDEPAEWRNFLKERGFVAWRNPLDQGDTELAVWKLLEDLRRLNPKEVLGHLGDVRERHLPASMGDNDLRPGLAHGEFAWFVRTHPGVQRLFEHLFQLPPGAPLVGSVDVVALAPPAKPEVSDRRGGKQWLHLDYTPRAKVMWQAQVQLFPSLYIGKKWERIAVMICKAPAEWSSLEAQKTLLACCITSTPSRATAGVTLGLTHERWDKRKRGKAGKHHQALLNSSLSDQELADWSARKGPRPPPGPLEDVRQEAIVRSTPSLPRSLEEVRQASVSDIVKLFTLEELQRVAAPRAVQYVRPGAEPSASLLDFRVPPRVNQSPQAGAAAAECHPQTASAQADQASRGHTAKRLRVDGL